MMHSVSDGLSSRQKSERRNEVSQPDYVEIALLTLLLDGDGTLGVTRYDRQQPQIVELPHLFMSIRHRLLIDLAYAGLPNVDTAQHEAVQRAWNNICALCVDNQE